MTQAWEADLVAVDEELARRLLVGAGHEPRTLRRLAEGWDRSVWVVDEELVVGFPRKQEVVPMIEREIALLPRIAPLVPAPIPSPLLVGVPSEAFPWPFYATRYLPGEEAALAVLDDRARGAIGIELARFLRALHGIELDAHLPVDPNGRADMASRTAKLRASISALEAKGLWRAPPALDALLGDALELPPPRLDCVVHGDLYQRNVLVAGGRLSGVIDWIDLGRSDPALDMSFLWSFVPSPARAEVLDAYGGLDEPGLLRARVLALFMGAVIAEYADATGHVRLAAFAQDALARTLAD